MKKVIVWFEIPVNDFARAKKFYSEIMQFEIKEDTIGNDRMGFFPGEKGEVSGAIVKGEGFEPGGKGTIVYLNGGDNLQVILDRVEPAGGKIITPKTQIAEEHGYYAWFLDTEGNKLGLWSEK
ncbi:MAG: VOC family protein [Candidatus Cloacimonetes bacterium]|nr:VOC family protein [Bacteroidota bacterium]MBL7149241.1 VOC family protein [Candidatus Cloacimonadota bacterium]